MAIDRNCMATVPKWEIFELKLVADKDFENPFLEVDLCVIFSNGKQKLSIDGYYDGQNEWKVRFAPMDEGEWHYETFSNIVSLDGQTGMFSCVAQISRGALTVSYQYPNWFFRADGRPQWVVNDGWYPHPLFGISLPFEGLDFPPPSEEDIKTYLKILGDHKVNMMLEVDQLYARQTTLTDTTFNWPWKVLDAENNLIDKDFFNLDFYQRMDRTLEYAKEQNVFYGLELLFDNSVFRPREWSAHPLNRKNGGWLDSNEKGTGWGVIFNMNNEEHMMYIERYLKYTIARFSAYWNVFWALGAESGNLAKVKGDELPGEVVASWYGHWGDYVAGKDVYGRLQAIGDTGEQSILIRHPRNNFIITQEHTSMEDIKKFYENTNVFGERFWNYGRPSVIGEQDRHNCNHYNEERKGYWVSFVSGFYMGRVDRHFGVAEKGKLVESNLFNIDGVPPIYGDLLHMSNFIEQSQINYWRMKPYDILIKAQTEPTYCLAAVGEEYLVYFPIGGKASLIIPEAEYSWFNPRTGTIFFTGHLHSGNAEFISPDSEDWVLYIKALPVHPK